MRALKIDSDKREVTEIDVNSLKDLQQAVGGLITYAHHLDNGDAIFVDDEGLFKSPEHFFMVKGTPQPFAGNGVVVGPTDTQGEETPAKSTVKGVRKLITFMTLGEVRTWANVRGQELF